MLYSLYSVEYSDDETGSRAKVLYRVNGPGGRADRPAPRCECSWARTASGQGRERFIKATNAHLGPASQLALFDHRYMSYCDASTAWEESAPPPMSLGRASAQILSLWALGRASRCCALRARNKNSFNLTEPIKT